MIVFNANHDKILINRRKVLHEKKVVDYIKQGLFLQLANLCNFYIFALYCCVRVIYLFDF